jgi:hypothetical protein
MSDDTESAIQMILDPHCKPPIEFGDFLTKAARDETMFDTIWQRARRRIQSLGYFSPAGPDDGPADPYLLMLAAQQIRSYKAFADIEASEYTVDELLHEEPVDRMWMLRGPPGSGKTILLDRFIGFVLGEWFYMLDGCPSNCRPESLLTLLSEEHVKKLPKEYGSTARLMELRARALEPCDHCQDVIFGKRDNPQEHPRLDQVKIQPVKLLARAGHGVAFWTPSDNKDAVPLEAALRQGTHLCLLRQPFAERGYVQGKTPPYHVLLEVVQGGHRLPDHTPYAGLVALETNEEGWSKFTTNVNDIGAYKRRIRFIRQPYVMALSREVRIYQKCLRELDQAAVFDPYVLEAIAVLAVVSRQQQKGDIKVSYHGADVLLDLQERMRVLDGDLALLELKFKQKGPAADAERVRYTSGTNHNFQLAEMLKGLRDAVGFKDGFGGLSEAFMKEEVVQPLGREGLSYPGGRVTFLNAIDFLVRTISEQRTMKDADADTDQKNMYDSCLTELKLAPAEPSIGYPRVVEAWYRWRLVQAMERAFYPDLDELRHGKFVDYYNLATAGGAGVKRFVNHAGRESAVSEEVIATVLKPVEDGMILTNAEEVKAFRGQLKARCAMYVRAEAERLGIGADDLDPSWDTLPEIARAITTLLAREHLETLEACLDDKKKEDKAASNDKPARNAALDAKLRADAMKNLLALGYSDESLKELLRYFRANKLWKFSTTF